MAYSVHNLKIYINITIFDYRVNRISSLVNIIYTLDKVRQQDHNGHVYRNTCYAADVRCSGHVFQLIITISSRKKEENLYKKNMANGEIANNKQFLPLPHIFQVICM